MSLVLGGQKMNKSLYLPTRILKVYTKALTGFSHVSSPDGLKNTLFSQDYVTGTVDKAYIPKTKQNQDPSIALVQLKGQPEVTS